MISPLRVQHVDGELAGDARGEGGDDGVLRFLAHLVSGVGPVQCVRSVFWALAHSESKEVEGGALSQRLKGRCARAKRRC